MSQKVNDTMISDLEMGMQDLVIMLNHWPTEQCPWCHERVCSVSFGPELFTAEHEGPVCTTCATKHDSRSMAVLAAAQTAYARCWADAHSLPSLYELAILADEWCHDGVVYAKAALWLQRRYKLAHDYNFPALLHGDHTDEAAQQHVLMNFFTGDEAAAVEAALRDQSVIGMELGKVSARLPLFAEYAAFASERDQQLRSGVYDFEFIETIDAHCCFYKNGEPIAKEFYAICTSEGELDIRGLGKRMLTSEETTRLLARWSRARDTGTKQTLAVRRPLGITEDDDWDECPF